MQQIYCEKDNNVIIKFIPCIDEHESESEEFKNKYELIDVDDTVDLNYLTVNNYAIFNNIVYSCGQEAPIYLFIGDGGIIQGLSYIDNDSFISSGITMDCFKSLISDKELDTNSWYYINHTFIKLAPPSEYIQELIEKIRYNRATICFPIINRGQLWYSHLTPTQLNELNTWYEAWLNAPETLIEPEAPQWLEGEING